MPQTQEQWLKIAHEFEARWNFPHCVGAMDGKHIAITAPANSGSLYYNYKHFNSIVLLAVADASYRFTYVDIGNCGRVSDGGVFNNSSLAAALEGSSLNLPPPDQIEGIATALPYVFVADDAFALKDNIMKPFSIRMLTKEQRVFNYRLSRARRTVESTFGIMSQRFHVFTKPVQLLPEKVAQITMAACCLHNFLLRDKESANIYMPSDCSLTNAMPNIARQGSNRHSANAIAVRNSFTEYFNSIGSVPWQDTANP